LTAFLLDLARVQPETLLLPLDPEVAGPAQLLVRGQHDASGHHGAGLVRLLALPAVLQVLTAQLYQAAFEPWFEETLLLLGVPLVTMRALVENAGRVGLRTDLLDEPDLGPVLQVVHHAEDENDPGGQEDGEYGKQCGSPSPSKFAALRLHVDVAEVGGLAAGQRRLHAYGRLVKRPASAASAGYRR